jgi:hypothetical protein
MSGIFRDGAYYPLGTGEEQSEAEYEYLFVRFGWRDHPKILELQAELRRR